MPHLFKANSLNSFLYFIAVTVVRNSINDVCYIFLGEAESKKIKADADAYEARQIAANQQAYQKQWDYEIQMERAKRWNGVEVSTQSVYVPNTYDLKSGK